MTATLPAGLDGQFYLYVRTDALRLVTEAAGETNNDSPLQSVDVLRPYADLVVEIIDPDTLEPVPEGVFGELVLSTLNREGMPIIRYRTRDITRILPGACLCGRAHKRLDQSFKTAF